MKVFIQQNANKQWFNVNAYSAASHFEQMGWEIIPFQKIEDVSSDLSREYPVVGGIGNVLSALDVLGVKHPELIDIPECLLEFANRRVWESTLGEMKAESNWPVFIKPLKNHKAFTGHVLKDFRDQFKTLGFPDEYPVLASEVVKFTSEYRCFVLNNEVLDMRRYAGRIDWLPDLNVVKDIVSKFKNSPVAYSVDVGDVLGHTTLIEVNDSYSLGIYGLPAHLQVKMLVTRWKEITQ